MIQEELEFASPMNPNSSTKDQQKSRKVDGRRACNWMVQRKAKRLEEVQFNGPKAMKPSLIRTSDKFPLGRKT